MKFLIGSGLLVFFCNFANSQVTDLDRIYSPSLRSARQFLFNVLGRTGDDPNYYATNRRLRKVQKLIPESTQFFCDVNGPGRRSNMPPETVHQLRPGDIDIVGAIGDSYTAGNGGMSTHILQILVENKGLSAFIGGQATWRKYLTVPNILKEFNPKLYGYSLQDGLSVHRSSKFNVAEPGAQSQDIIHQAKNLVKRMKSDPNVNMSEHWKLVSLMIGGNDFCSDVCFMNPPEKAVDIHEKELVTTLRILRDNIPRLMVNIILPPNPGTLADAKGIPTQCRITHYVECGCFFSPHLAPYRKRYESVIQKWSEKEMEIANRDEFQNRNDFTVNVQTFIQNLTIPNTKSGLSDFTYFSSDCFHLSQKGYARAANALWNNMLEPEGKKAKNWKKEFKNLKCPTVEKPFLATKKN